MNAAMPRSDVKVLIVEDEFLVAMQLEDTLLDHGYTVLGTIPDFAALATLSEAPDVAFVDLNLRDGLTGPAIARKLAARFGSRVIYITANPDQIDTPADTAIGVIQKPFSTRAVLAALAYTLSDCPEAAWPAGLEPLNRVMSGRM
jgi:DNA-binding response OmpR family regulator